MVSSTVKGRLRETNFEKLFFVFEFILRVFFLPGTYRADAAKINFFSYFFFVNDISGLGFELESYVFASQHTTTVFYQ